ncbi:MAG: SigE family RNA polymerase sigma factor [Acidimicrobiales bacterium]
MAARGTSVQDDSGYDRFFEECLPLVLHLARRLTGDETQAEDVAVEALGRAYAHWDRVRLMTHARAWVMKVATNLVIGQARRRPVARPPEPSSPDTADVVVLRLALLGALNRLPRRQREAVALRYLVDLPEIDVATAMGVSTGSVKKHLNRGLASLRRTLGAELEQGEGLGLA